MGVVDNCQVCAAVAAEGFNSTGLIHCNVCCQTWTGLGRAHCTVCHQTFNSDRAASLHWTALYGHNHPVNVDIFSLRDGIWYVHSEWNPSEVFARDSA